MPTVVISRGSRMGKSATCVRLLQEQGFDLRMIGDDEFGLGLTGDEKVVEVLRGASAVIAAGERYNATVLGSLPALRVFVWSPVPV